MEGTPSGPSHGLWDQTVFPILTERVVVTCSCSLHWTVVRPTRFPNPKVVLHHSIKPERSKQGFDFRSTLFYWTDPRVSPRLIWIDLGLPVGSDIFLPIILGGWIHPLAIIVWNIFSSLC